MAYVKDKETLEAEKRAQARRAALDSYVEDSRLTGARNAIIDRKSFSYDPTRDPLYLNARDAYERSAKLAMADTMGQAASLNGGYGTSYAQSAGQQAYHAQMQVMNDILPELVQTARQNYDADTAALKDRYQLLYGEDADNRSRLENEYGTALNEYLTLNDAGYSRYRDDIADKLAAEQLAYQKQRDAVADAQWQKQYELSQRKADTSGGGTTEKEVSYKKLSSADQTKLDKYSENGDFNGVRTLLENAGISPEDYEKYMKQYGGYKDISTLSAGQQAAGLRALISGKTAYYTWLDEIESMGYNVDEVDKLIVQKQQKNADRNLRK